MRTVIANPPRFAWVLVITNSSKVPWRVILHELDMFILRNQPAYQAPAVVLACMITMADIIGIEQTFCALLLATLIVLLTRLCKPAQRARRPMTYGQDNQTRMRAWVIRSEI